jgi:predicted anti-sigma-YlaC factor YlaD
MKCKKIRSFFYDYADSTVDAATCSAIESHLSGCVSCRLYYETQRRVHQNVAAAAAGELAGLHFMSMPIKAEMSAGYARPRMSLWGRHVAVATSCLIVFYGMILMLRKPASRSADDPPPAAYAEAYHCLEMYRAGSSSASGSSMPLAVIIQPGAPARVIELDATTDISTAIK